MQKAGKSSASAQSASADRRPGNRKLLRRSSILRGHSAFSGVLNDGRSLHHPPIRLFYRTIQGSRPNAQVGFAVSRSFRSAVQRNKAKRLLREAYRTHQDLWTPLPHRIEAVWMYVGSPDNDPEFGAVEQAVVHLMERALDAQT